MMIPSLFLLIFYFLRYLFQFPGLILSETGFEKEKEYETT